MKKTLRLRFSGRDYAFMFVNMVTDDFACIGTRATALGAASATRPAWRSS